MKKTYFAPETEIVNVQVESLMAVSGEGNNLDVTVAGDYEEGIEVLSRRGSLWDDDEE